MNSIPPTEAKPTTAKANLVLESDDPFEVLGLTPDASEQEVRAAYLSLVKQFPPEREPDKFRAIQAAYEMARDPLLQARRLIEPPDDVPTWQSVIDRQSKRPPHLTPEFLLSLGNRSARQ